MKKMNVALLVLGVFCFGMVAPAFSGIVGNEECSRRCAEGYKRCKKHETTETAVNNISCHEMREMCSDRCRNITAYVGCKEKCGNDQSCLKDCKNDFQGNVNDYSPYLNHRK
ncbi:MAG: hypothetical protein JXK94_05175 [Deltaproteobacteria bacterium]|nr:hypothetical protein [Deltaproteobacteria bacterium]